MGSTKEMSSWTLSSELSSIISFRNCFRNQECMLLFTGLCSTLLVAPKISNFILTMIRIWNQLWSLWLTIPPKIVRNLSVIFQLRGLCKGQNIWRDTEKTSYSFWKEANAMPLKSGSWYVKHTQFCTWEKELFTEE